MMSFFLVTFWFCLSPLPGCYWPGSGSCHHPLDKRFILPFLREQQTVEGDHVEQAGVSPALLVISSDAGSWHHPPMLCLPSWEGDSGKGGVPRALLVKLHG